MAGYRVRVSGYEPPKPQTTVRLPRFGGRYRGRRIVTFWPTLVLNVDFSGLRFDDFYADGTWFVGCDFSCTTFEGGSFSTRWRTTFRRCTFDEASLRYIDPGQSRFVRCSFSDVDMTRWSPEAAEFVACRFAGPLRECVFWGHPFGAWLEPGNLRPRRTANEFRGNDFSAASLRGVSFRGGIDLDAQRLPEGREYVRLDRLGERIARARLIVAGWEPREVRDEALLMLDVFENAGDGDPGEGEARQEELFAHRYDTGVARPVADRVWALLESVM